MRFRANFLNRQHPLLDGILIAVFCMSIVWMQYNYFQNQFWLFWPYVTVAFAAYALINFRSIIPLKYLIAIGIFVRICLIFSFPNLSDDVYRFFWDGTLSVSGWNPYGVLPSDVVVKNLPILDQSLFQQLNSPDYYTIYPPLNQLIFAIGAYTKDLHLAAIVMKTIFLVSEGIGLLFLIKLLHQLKKDSRISMWYFLNPLVIIEGIGNMHFETIMLSTLCISIYYIFNNKLIYGSFWMAVSISIKLLPLMILPYFFFKLYGSDRVKFFGWLSICLVGMFLPMAGSIEFASFFDSVDLYFRKFEFNASVYYVLRYLGFEITGYNLIKYIGPLLAISTIGLNLRSVFVQKSYDLKSFMTYALFVWTIYLFFATTVHPWYVISIIFFGILTNMQYPIIWSYLIFITYINYSNIEYNENLYAITLEYVVVFFIFLYEYGKLKRFDKITIKSLT